jgi:transcriptional regulator GlxA family with amidase domain
MRQIHILVYEGFEVLDMAGPAGVFGSVNAVLGREVYVVRPVSVDGGPVCCSHGFAVQTSRLEPTSARDTVVVVGAEAPPLRRAIADIRISAWLAEAATAGSRVASVCTGTFLLGKAGLLNGTRVTTHWEAHRHLAKQFPKAIVENDVLYINDRQIWSSAGITAGIDLALAMVSSDLGPSVMHKAAKRMVVYGHRPGEQSQFSPLLAAQTRVPDVLSNLVAFIDANLSSNLSLERLASVAFTSERTLNRIFKRHFGMPPAAYVEAVRMDRACQLLEQGLTVKQVTEHVGYKSEQGFRASFEARFQVPPSSYKSPRNVVSKLPPPPSGKVRGAKGHVPDDIEHP